MTDDPIRTPEDLLAHAQLAADGGKAPPWPQLPAIDASELELRVYLTAALGLVLGYHVGRVERHGPYGSDSVVIEVITPTGRRAIRFDQLDHIAEPKMLRKAVVAQLDGVTLMRPVKAPEAFDVFRAVCRLASVVEHATHLEDTTELLGEYVAGGHRIILPLGTSDDRYDSLGRLKARGAFDRERASAYVRGGLDADQRWIVLIDAALTGAWIRKGELLTYLRHVLGLPAAPSRTWDAKVREAGGEFVAMTADRRYRGTGGGLRHELRFYRLPEPVVASM